MVGSAEHSQSKFPLSAAAAAAAARPVAIGDDDAGGRGHVTRVLAGARSTLVDDEDGMMSTNEDGTVARRTSSTAELQRHLDLQRYRL